MKMLGLRCSVNRESGEFPERWRMVAMTLTKVCAQDTNNKQHFGVDVEHLKKRCKTNSVDGDQVLHKINSFRFIQLSVEIALEHKCTDLKHKHTNKHTDV